MEVFKLVGSIMVDNSEANNSIRKTSEETQKLGGKLGEAFSKAKEMIAGVAGVALEVGKAVVGAAQDFAADMDVIDKASQRMGISAERYQELAYAAEMSGVSMGVMEKAAKKLEGTDLNFDDALTGIMALDDETERMAAAAELFGDSVAYEMTPLLKAGADGLKDMTDEANALGLVMSDEVVAGGAAMGDSFAKIQKTMQAVGNQVMSRLMPSIQRILDYITAKLPEVMDIITSVLDKIMPLVEPILSAIMSGLMGLWNIFSGVVDMIMPYIDPVVAALKSLMEGTFALLSGDFQGFIDGIMGFFSNAIPAIIGLGSDIINGLWDGLKSAWTSVEAWFGSMIERVKNWFADVRDSIAGFFGFGGDSDGSHAAGLATVPYDGYKATLHRGETVLNANDTSELVSLLRSGSTGSGDSAPIHITVQSVLDGRVIGESVTTYQRNKSRAFG